MPDADRFAKKSISPLETLPAEGRRSFSSEDVRRNPMSADRIHLTHSVEQLKI